MRAAAEAFGGATGIPVEVAAGPTGGWAGRVADKADLVFSEADCMIDDFVAQFRDPVLPETRTTPY